MPGYKRWLSCRQEIGSEQILPPDVTKSSWQQLLIGEHVRGHMPSNPA
jgi:hypothetical protein